jgi:nucleotide-binding universal stress UspA family protein
MEHTVNRDEPHGLLSPPHGATGPIVVASDGAPPSVAAFDLARQLAERSGARVEVVSALEPTNVVVPPIDAPSPPTHAGASRVAERHARLADLMHHALGDAPVWPAEIVLGDRVPSISRVVTERQAQLVVTGHTHHGAVERLARSETPLGIARAARVPVLTVPTSMHHLPRCVVVAVGFGDAGTGIGRIAHALFGDALTVHLVHVRAPSLPHQERVLREDDAAEDADIERAFEHARTAWTLPADVSVASHVLVGRPAGQLRAFADTVGADLVVAGLTVRAGMHYLPHRSLAPWIYREWPGALLVVPVGEAAGRRPLDAGTTVSTDERRWPDLLQRLARRNVRRTASLAVDDRVGGTHILARRRPLVGLEYDPHAHTAIVMLADETPPVWHLTHRVVRPVVLAVHEHPAGHDDAIVVGYDGGQMLLTFE